MRVPGDLVYGRTWAFRRGSGCLYGISDYLAVGAHPALTQRRGLLADGRQQAPLADPSDSY